MGSCQGRPRQGAFILTLDSPPRHLQSSWERSATQFSWASFLSHADTDVILRAVDQAPWREKDMFQVFVKEQEEDVFLLPYSGGSAQNKSLP